MMQTNTNRQNQKHFFIHSYRHLWQVEEVIQQIRQNATAKLQFSVLGKLAQDCFSNEKGASKAKKELKAYWKGSLGPNYDFGFFCNPEIGALFIVGSLVSQFLHDMDGRVLGEIPSGPYGILRGLGVSENNASMYIKDLNRKYFLLILRGYDHELKTAEELVENLG